MIFATTAARLLGTNSATTAQQPTRPSLKRSEMKSETKRRLRAMSNAEKEKRLDELNRKLGITQPQELIESDVEESEEREWLKKKLGYQQH